MNMYEVELNLYHTDTDLKQNQSHFVIEVSMDSLPAKNEKFRFNEKWLDRYEDKMAHNFEKFFSDKSPEFIAVEITDYKDSPATFDYTLYAVGQLIEDKSAFFEPKDKPLDN